jgi:hypothetical protein
MRTLIREEIRGALNRERISAVGLITQRPLWRAHEDTSHEDPSVLEGVVLK